jgi:regulator of protease activity HflC (stomatin/prohibitin superfamily)
MQPIYFVLILLLMIVFSAIKILREYERGVIFLLGKFYKVKGPGIIIVIPGVQKMVKVSLRTVVMDVPPQDIITRDNVTVKVNAVVYFRVIDPRKAIIEVEDFLYATSQICQTTLRSILGQSQLDDLLSNTLGHQSRQCGSEKRRPATGNAEGAGQAGGGGTGTARQGHSFPRRIRSGGQNRRCGGYH